MRARRDAEPRRALQGRSAQGAGDLYIAVWVLKAGRARFGAHEHTRNECAPHHTLAQGASAAQTGCHSRLGEHDRRLRDRARAHDAGGIPARRRLLRRGVGRPARVDCTQPPVARGRAYVSAKQDRKRLLSAHKITISTVCAVVLCDRWVARSGGAERSGRRVRDQNEGARTPARRRATCTAAT